MALISLVSWCCAIVVVQGAFVKMKNLITSTDILQFDKKLLQSSKIIKWSDFCSVLYIFGIEKFTKFSLHLWADFEHWINCNEIMIDIRIYTWSGFVFSYDEKICR